MADVIAGRYVLLSSLGRGGMGEVFLADDLVLGRRVAIKRILTSGSAPDRVALERLVREARLAATLHHPNVVAVHDLVTDGDRTHIVMEFVDSRSLAEMIRAKKRLEPVVAGRIGTQIASALEAAHRAGIIHRDVKPSNILVDDQQVAKLADFGVARSAGDPGLTGTGMMIGSVAFMAPEIARGEAVTSAADIYSLGSTLFAAIEGHAPFASEAEPSSSMRMLARLITESAPYSTHGGPFAGLIRRMMASDPTDRPTAGEVQRSLAVLTAGPPPERQVVPVRADEDATRVTTPTKPEVPRAPTGPDVAPDQDWNATVPRGSVPVPVSTTPEVDPHNAALQRLVDYKNERLTAGANGGLSSAEVDGAATVLRGSVSSPTTPEVDPHNAALQRLVDDKRARLTAGADSGAPSGAMNPPRQLRSPCEAPSRAADSPPVPAVAPPVDVKKRWLLVAVGAAVLIVVAGTLIAVRWAGVLNGVAALAAGGSHTCALAQDGTVRCWGNNSSGQLGDGTTDQRARPVVTGLTGVTALSAGRGHTCAVTQDGGATCWGANDSGQLGDGTTTERANPGPVTGLSGVAELAAGGSHTCALTEDGRVRCWGNNDSGQLGDGTTSQRTEAVTVKGLDGVTALAA
ncbi:MAG: protein kinase, partial [Propionicimonas sp.]